LETIMATAPDQPSAQLPGEVDKKSWLESHEAGYHKTLGNRQVQMIAIGGAIGTGLFLGAGARLQIAGPALALVYLVCGVFSFLILRALGELSCTVRAAAALCRMRVSSWGKRRHSSPAGCTSSTGR
jgi:L-asparagine transporter-like permease